VDNSTLVDVSPTSNKSTNPEDEDDGYLDIMLQKMIDVLTLGVYKV